MSTLLAAEVRPELGRTIGVSLEGLAPADYELVLLIEDETAHAATSRTEAFSVGSSPSRRE